MEYYWDGKIKDKSYYYADGLSELMYKYHSLCYLTEIEYPDGSYTEYDFDPFGRVAASRKFDAAGISDGEYSFN